LAISFFLILFQVDKNANRFIVLLKVIKTQSNEAEN